MQAAAATIAAVLPAAVARPRENPLDLVPIAPHLRGSEVLKMLHEDNPDSGEGSWVTHADDKGPSKGTRNRANWPVARRQVCWPPKDPDYVEVAPPSGTNQVPANQASANYISANQASPLVNHASNNHVAVNGATVVYQEPAAPAAPEIPAAPAADPVVEQIEEAPSLPPVAAAPEIPVAPADPVGEQSEAPSLSPVAAPEIPAAPADLVVEQNEAPSLPPTGAKVPPPVPPRPANYPQPQPADICDGPAPPNMTTTQFPAGFKMRDQAPVQQTPPVMILSQPAFKITQPLKQKGDKKWPPKGDIITQEQVREFTKHKGPGNRDYSEFFAQNALPQTFTSYRAPPGTQHHGEVSEM